MGPSPSLGQKQAGWGVVLPRLASVGEGEARLQHKRPLCRQVPEGGGMLPATAQDTSQEQTGIPPEGALKVRAAPGYGPQEPQGRAVDPSRPGSAR